MTQEQRQATDLRLQQAAKLIWVTFAQEGVHHYPQALHDPQLSDVSFLGYPHRHQFHFKVAIEVFHDDRDIEFLQFKRWLTSLYGTGVLDLNNHSCEMIADDLFVKIAAKYPNRSVIISVSEDNENGCEINYPRL